jgi:hypothetical protein
VLASKGIRCSEKLKRARVRRNLTGASSKAKSLAVGFCSERENNQHDHRRNDQG